MQQSKYTIELCPIQFGHFLKHGVIKYACAKPEIDKISRHKTVFVGNNGIYIECDAFLSAVVGFMAIFIITSQDSVNVK